MFSSFLIHERRGPPLSAGVALPTAQYHNCVVFNISVERTEHALNNILYREKVLYIRIIEKLKENLSVLKIFPASVSEDGNQGIVPSTRCVYCTCLYQTQILSDVKTEGRRNAECNAMGKKRLDRDDTGSTGRVHTSLWVIGVATKRTLRSTQCCSQRLAYQCTARQTHGEVTQCPGREAFPPTQHDPDPPEETTRRPTAVLGRRQPGRDKVFWQSSPLLSRLSDAILLDGTWLLTRQYRDS